MPENTSERLLSFYAIFSIHIKGEFTKNENVLIQLLLRTCVPFFLLQKTKEDHLKNVGNRTVSVIINFYRIEKTLILKPRSHLEQ